jgi:LPXTG-motif cell wall-anchored protein
VLWFLNTFTPNENPTSSCNDLDANPSSGTEDLTVELTGNASDSNGSIQQYEYNFGDGTIVTESDNKSTHTYTTPGNYTAVLKVKDSRGNWVTSDACRVNVNVNAKPEVLGTTPPKELPKTGFSGLTFAAISTISTGVGIYLYKRFRLL